MAQTLLDQKEAGKMLLLITNSDYEYTARMMAFAYDRFLPDGMTWRDLFDMVGAAAGAAREIAPGRVYDLEAACTECFSAMCVVTLGSHG
jgi:hypothetical protein